MGSLSFDVQEGISRSITVVPPTHYTLKINNFSLLAKNSIDRYESGEFQAGGYKWKLVVYPNGNKNKNEKEHVSVYLAIVKENSLPTGWQVYANFSLFLHDQNKDNYMVLQCKGECLSMSKDAIMNKHVWRVENFSKLVAAGNDSITFNAGDHTWKIKLYPRGKGNGLGTHLSLYLALSNPTTLPPGTKIYANFTLRVLCHIDAKYHHYAKGKKKLKKKKKFYVLSKWFSASDYEHGLSRFMTLPYFTGYFLITDTCTVEAEVTVHGVAGAL
ncbi:hypothetical protein FEM48_Zijuj12G0129700 [Ziziphus jujuba var. spinosa]|uniref:MATH domain-containing protein n=1 Tax=Ziziphus jujuba var. spinosa TaxID=714518 RepID=A0A978UDG9_ZIZJJ|nr:hypothetical protein FEM48_Zijuj12G0129700 [Ziziphus jujuba var. spinosa]